MSIVIEPAGGRRDFMSLASRAQKLLSGWTFESVEALRALWARGASAAQIADTLNLEFSMDITRSAVCGKASREGLRKRDARVNGASAKAQKARIARANPAEVRPKPTQLQIVEAGARAMKRMAEEVAPRRSYTLENLPAGGCLWPYGDPRTAAFRYCGDPREAERSYCPCHAARAYAGFGS